MGGLTAYLEASTNVFYLLVPLVAPCTTESVCSFLVQLHQCWWQWIGLGCYVPLDSDRPAVKASTGFGTRRSRFTSSLSYEVGQITFGTNCSPLV